MSQQGSEDFVTAYVARDDVEGRALVVLLRDKGIPASSEARQASNTFVQTDTQTSILTSRKDVARARAIIEGLAAEERERLRRSMSETVFMALDQRQIEQIIQAEKAAVAARTQSAGARTIAGDKTLILQAHTAVEANAAAAYLERSGVPAVVVGGGSASPGMMPGVYVPAGRAGEARDLIRKYLDGDVAPLDGTGGPGPADGERESVRGTVRDADSIPSGLLLFTGVLPRIVALGFGAALLGYSASGAPNPILVMLIGAPLLIILAWLCFSESVARLIRKRRSAERRADGSPPEV